MCTELGTILSGRKAHGNGQVSPTSPEGMVRVPEEQEHQTPRFKRQEVRAYRSLSPPWEAFGHNSGEKMNKVSTKKWQEGHIPSEHHKEEKLEMGR